MYPTLRYVFQEAVYGAGGSARLRAQGMEFAVWVTKHAETHQLRAMAPTVLQARQHSPVWVLVWLSLTAEASNQSQ